MTNEFKGLRHYIDIVESKEQAVDEAGIMNALGQLGGAVAGTVANGANAVGNAVSGAYDAAKKGISGAVDAAGNAISGAVAPVVQGAKTGYANATGEPAPAPTQQASTGAGAGRGGQGGPTAAQLAANSAEKGQSASPKAGGKSDPAVLKLQQDLIAKGAKIKADGIMGPATQAAQKQFGGQAASPTPAATPAAAVDTAPVPASANASSSMTGAPAASNATANTTGGPANLGTAGTQATAGGYAPAPAAAAPENPFAPKADPKVAAWSKLSPAQQKWMGGADPTDPIILARMRKAVPDAPVAAPQQATMEGAGYDEIQRLVSLVQYR
jgi:hypothetical protein